MRTAGLMMNDVWAHRVLRERGVETMRLEQVPAEVGVLVETVEMRHHGQEQKYRPYLHVTGELRSIRPGDELPYGITELTYTAGQGEAVDAFYEFDDQQLVELAAKGYFREEFTTPGDVTGFEWELPATIDVVMLAPDPQVDGGGVPVVFTHVHDRGDLVIGLDSSGYDLTEYFEDYSRAGIIQPEAAVGEHELRTRSDQLDSLFGEEVFALETEQAAPVWEQTSEIGQDDMESRKQAIEAEIEAEREQFQADRAAEDGTLEQVYAERIAQSLTGQVQPAEETDEIPPRPEHEPWTQDGDLDFGFDDEDDQETEKISLAERKRQVSRAAAELTHDETDHGRQY